MATGATFNDIVQARGDASAKAAMKECRDACAAAVARLLGVSPIPAPGGYTDEMQQVFRIFGSDQPTKVPAFVTTLYTQSTRDTLLVALDAWVAANP